MPKRSPTHRKRSHPEPLETDDEETGTQETDSVIEPSMRDPGIFDGLTAWFSFSVSPARVANWTGADGKVVEIDEAMYVFSEDASSNDTVDVFESDDYLLDNLSVFHALYIDACLEKGSMTRVKLGTYSLPPIEVQVRIAPRVNFPWDTTKPSVDVVSNQLSAIQTSPTTKRQMTQFPRNNASAQPLSSQYHSNVNKPLAAKRRLVQPMNSVQVSQTTSNIQTQSTMSHQKQPATNPLSSVNSQKTQPAVTEQTNPATRPVTRSLKDAPKQGQQLATTQHANLQAAQNQASQRTGTQQKSTNSQSDISTNNTLNTPAVLNLKNKPDSGEENVQIDIDVQPLEMKSPPPPKKGSKSVYLKPAQKGDDVELSDGKSAHPELSAYIPIEALSLVHGDLDDFVHGVDNCQVQFKKGQA